MCSLGFKEVEVMSGLPEQCSSCGGFGCGSPCAYMAVNSQGELLRFNPNSNQHLEWALKLLYRYSSGDLKVSSGEAMSASADALCNLIGDDKFVKWNENN